MGSDRNSLVSKRRGTTVNVPDGLIRACVDRVDSEFAVVDEDGVIRYTNDAWQEYAMEGGIPGDPAMIGENYFEAIQKSRDEDRYADAACDGIDALLSEQKDVFRLEYPCPAPDNPAGWFLVWASLITFEDDRYVVIEHIEITDRKQAERRLEARNETLESVASILAHDIRNPMSAAMAWGQAVANADEPDPEHIDRMISSLRRMDAMIDDALLLARGLRVERTEQIGIQRVAMAAWDAVAPETATLEVEKAVACEADPSLLQTLFENLFRNAVEHGKKDVTVRIGTLEHGFYVEDDGPGIPADERESVFDVGYTTRSSSENTGMGLPIVNGIANAHDWDIELTSSRSGGARFEITGMAIRDG